MELDEGDYSSASELSSNEELQVGLAEGTIKPGLVGKVDTPKTYTNNVSGLREKLAALKRKGQTDWLERMDVTPQTVTYTPTPTGGGEGMKEGEGGGEGATEGRPDPNDDFKREMWFYQQAKEAAGIGVKRLKGLGIPITRPEDYYAEMVKNDDHMRKVRETLLSRQKVLEQREKARKMRELKRFGKKVQHEILQKRREEKKSALESVKKYRKGRGEKPGFLKHGGKEEEEDEDKFAVSTSRENWQGSSARKSEVGKGGGGGGKSKKREYKDKKFGMGGKKRGSKSNTATSSSDMTSFSSGRHSKPQIRKKRGGGGGASGGGGGGGRGGGGGKAQRLGKSRRQKIGKRQ